MDALEETYDAEVEREGYPAPTNIDSYFLDIYIGNTGANDGENIPEISWAGAYTSIYTTDYQLEEPEMSYIVIHPDILQYLPAIQEIAAHEFFHVLQFAIWLDNYPNGYFDSESNWWWEATATWMEDEVYDDIDQYVYFLNYYMENPHKALHEFTSGAPHQYAMCIWAIYLDETYDGNQTIFDLWTDPDPAGILVATDEYLTENYQSDLSAAFRDFLAKVSMLDFDEGSSWDQVALTDSVSEYPYVQGEDEVASKSLPRILGANIYKLRPGTSSGTLTIEFDGQGTYNDNDLDWNVMVLAVPADKADYQVYQLETEDESEAGTLQVAGFGSEIDEVWLAFAPFPNKIRSVDKFGTSRGFDYAWAADVSAADDDDDSGDDDDDSGCGC